MTSTPFRSVCVLLLLTVGCVHNDYRPRHDVRRLLQEQLECDDVQVAFTWVTRTEQFAYQRGPQQFGAVSISIAH